MFAMVAGLISVPLLVAGLGREAFGLWALVMTLSATNGWLSLLDLGVVVGVTREVAARAAIEDSRGVREVVSASLRVVLVLGVLGGGVLSGAAVTFLPGLFDAPGRLASSFRTALLLMAVQVVADLCINTLEGALEGLQRVDLSRSVDGARRLLVLAGTAVGALVGGDLRWVAAGSLAATVVAMAIAAAALWRRLPRFLVPATRGQMSSMLRSGRAVAALRPLGVIQRTMDRLIVGVFFGPGAVALVEVATQLQAGADAVMSASSYSVVPSSSWLHARRDAPAVRRLALRGTKYSMLATIPVAIGVAVTAPSFIDLWLDSRFAAAAGLTAVAIVAVVANSPLAVGSQLLLGTGRTTSILRAALVAVLVNLVVSVVLLQFFGIVGVFWGTVVSAFVLAAIMGPAVLDVADVSAAEALRVALLPAVAPGVAQLAVSLALLQMDLDPLPELLAVGGVGVAVYAAVALATAVSREELRELRLT